MRRAVVFGLLAASLGGAAFEAGRRSVASHLERARADLSQLRLHAEDVLATAATLSYDCQERNPLGAALDLATLQALDSARIDADARAIRRAGRPGQWDVSR